MGRAPTSRRCRSWPRMTSGRPTGRRSAASSSTSHRCASVERGGGAGAGGDDHPMNSRGAFEPTRDHKFPSRNDHHILPLRLISAPTPAPSAAQSAGNSKVGRAAPGQAKPPRARRRRRRQESVIGAQITAGGQAPAPQPGPAYLQSEPAPDGTGPWARPATPPRLAFLAVYGESAANSHAIPVGITLNAGGPVRKLPVWHIRSRWPSACAGPGLSQRPARSRCWKPRGCPF